MAVAAYAYLVSLTNVLDNVQNRVQLHLNHMDLNQLEALKQNVCFLLGFVEAHSQTESPQIKGLWRQVAEVALEADDVLDLHMVDQLHQQSGGDTIIVGNSSFAQDIHRVNQRMVSIRMELLTIEEEDVDVSIDKQPGVSEQLGSLTSSSSPNNIMVGFDKHEQHILKELIHDKDSLQIISITGMGGIGKTTLASSVFKHPTIKDHFHICLWSSISQQYSIREILDDLLYDGKSEESDDEDLEILGVNLHKKLFGRRYFIVLDDVWSSTAWDDIKRFFPNCRNGSRVIITTRLLNVASSITSQEPYLIGFLNESESWNLLRQNIFVGEGKPNSKLEKIGREIAKACRGLPLAIIVIGRLLAKSNLTREYWEFVVKNVSWLGNLGDDEQNCLNILSLSYNSLPIHLKPCFLYVRKFPEDCKIRPTDLVQSWVAEGFIKLRSDKTLEESAKEYLNDLVSRSLFFVRTWNEKTGQVEEYGVHDLLRDLCFTESKKEQFVLSPKVQKLTVSLSTCYLCGEKNIMHKVRPKLVLTIPSTSRVHRYMCCACTVQYSKLRLVGVVEVFVVDTSYTKHDLEELVLQTQVHHISFKIGVYFKFLSPSTFHLFWNLQYLYLMKDPNGGLPCEIIWNMPQLRHIECYNPTVLPKPTNTNVEGKHAIILKNLQTIDGIKGFPCTVEVIDRIPNLRVLSIFEERGSTGSPNLNLLAKLQKLEQLSLLYPSNKIEFPNSLRRLKIEYCNFCWEAMTVIGSLPNLEALHLKDLIGSKWNPIEVEFLQWKRLEIGSCNLVWWRANQNHFPKLERLYLSWMYVLEEIPLDIGDIATLRYIGMLNCCESVVNSAKLILEEQQSLGMTASKLIFTIRGVRRW